MNNNFFSEALEDVMDPEAVRAAIERVLAQDDMQQALEGNPDLINLLCIDHGSRGLRAVQAKEKFCAKWKAFPKALFNALIDKAWETLEAQAKAAQGGNVYILNSKDVKVPNVANAITMMRSLPLAYNRLTCRTTITEPSPWGSTGPLTDNDDIKAAEWCQRDGLNIKKDIAADAAETLAREHPVHPVRDYLTALKWDGTPRISEMLTKYFGCEDSHYVRSVGRKWLISGVARVMRPGCQADYTLIIGGPQGIQKSTALRILGGDFFTDDISDIGSKDSCIQLQGKWIVELAELDALRRADASTIKAWLVRRVDNFRPPYGRRNADFPRQNIFAATTNKDDWGRDETGLRRFWAVTASRIYIEALAEDRDQLWAEAFAMYTEGEPWHLGADAEAQAVLVQQEHQEVHPWAPRVEEWLASPTSLASKFGEPSFPFRTIPGEKVYISDILSHCLDKPIKDWKHSDKLCVATILQLAGWKKKREPKPDGRG